MEGHWEDMGRLFICRTAEQMELKETQTLQVHQAQGQKSSVLAEGTY